MSEKTHFRKAFHSPYLSSADIVEPTILTIKNVKLESDKTKKTKDLFNTAYFVEMCIRDGEQLKPMILNATNSKMMRDLTGSPFIDDWNNISIMVYVDKNVKFGRETMEGLRISQNPNTVKKPEITKDKKTMWENAKLAYKRDGNFLAVLSRAEITNKNMDLMVSEINEETRKDFENANT